MLSESFQNLARVNPGVAEFVAARLAEKPVPVAPELIHLLASETLWALAIEASFGQTVAAGYAELVGAVGLESVHAYRRCVREAGRAGPTQGAILAEGLLPVLVHGDADLLERFRTAWAAMVSKGTYVLKAPLQALGSLLRSGDRAGAAAYLDLLGETFRRDLAYEETRYFTAALPQAALRLAPPRRCWQLAALGRVLRVDHRLAEPFLSGLARGLGRLEEKALAAFIDDALRPPLHLRDLTARCLALESRASQETFAGLQVRVGLAQVQDRLLRYLQARTGRGLAVRPLSALPAIYAGAIGPDRMVCSDGAAIYVPDDIGRFGRKQENQALYTALVRLEASFHEFGTTDFDLDKAVEHYPSVRARFESGVGAPHAEGESTPAAADSGRTAARPQGSDLERLFDRFPDKELAAELFTVFELGRIRHGLQRQYPGLVDRYYPLLRETALTTLRRKKFVTFCDGLLLRVALAVPAQEWFHPDAAVDGALGAVTAAFEAGIRPATPVEASAELAARFFESARASGLGGSGGPMGPRGGLAPPFGWQPWPNPAAEGATAFTPQARRLKALFAAAGHAAYTTDIRRCLAANAGALTAANIRALFGSDLGAMGVEALLRLTDLDGAAPSDLPPENGPARCYPEWDLRLGDYLPEHVRLRELDAAPDGGEFYAEVLRRHQDLVRRTRVAFERMRPEGLKRLRRWSDGDEFDYRQLIEAWVDRRTGALPLDRLFVKRVKDRRDVAVLLLTDVSRSTANRVPGADASVLDVEKEAIVVLCEALSLLGDDFAAAGFSGSGRHGVDYFHIKEFGEPLSEAVRGRIGALRPQRNTRMGAAIRHAANHLAKAPGRVRLLIILSDGFPNDTGYKGAYAVADTRQALLELGARQIRFHALTVNLPADPKLDELYGKARHHVISDVRELPERLLRVYSALTR